MFFRWLLGVGLVTALGAGPSAGGVEPDRAGYEAARAAAGRDAASHVELALWCEAHGLTSESAKHLAIAVLTDPKNAAARGLLGLVESGGRWLRPDAFAAKLKADGALVAKLAEYNARRDRMGRTADAHWKLAVWCEESGLVPEARAHFATVTRLDPSREAAWKRLGCRKVGQRWVTAEQVAAEKAEAAEQKKADRHWEPLLTRWQGWLRHKDGANRDTAREQLAAVSDPRAVPMIWAVFGLGDEASQEIAVQVLAQVDAGTASRALATLAIAGKSAEVRRRAVETLRRRDPRDFVGFLIGMIRDPLKYEVRPVGGPGDPGVLFVEGKRFDVRRVYGVNAFQRSLLDSRLASMSRLFGSSVPFNPFSDENLWIAMGPDAVRVPNAHGQAVMAPNATVLAARRDIEIGRQLLATASVVNASQLQLNDDVRAIDAYNSGAVAGNGRILPVLSAVTGREPSGSSETWRRWWTDQEGYAYEAEVTGNKPTLTVFLPNPAIRSSTSCFAAGTPVRTLDGPRPIESIRVGDRVLTQDTTTGRLDFAPVLAVAHNKPAATLKVAVGAESIVATGIHRFWKAGRGWAMARDLRPGDALRTLDGVRTVAAVEGDSTQPVYNLRVADGRSFFVGEAGVLVHDNSVVSPVAVPFDAVPALAAVAPADR